MNETERLMTVKEVADYLQMHVQNVRDYIRKGLIKASRIGNGKNGRYRIWYSDLKEFINKNANVKG